VVITFIEITARKKTEQAIRESEGDCGEPPRRPASEPTFYLIIQFVRTNAFGKSFRTWAFNSAM
jgi:hypothetical protein